MICDPHIYILSKNAQRIFPFAPPPSHRRGRWTSRIELPEIWVLDSRHRNLNQQPSKVGTAYPAGIQLFYFGSFYCRLLTKDWIGWDSWGSLSFSFYLFIILYYRIIIWFYPLYTCPFLHGNSFFYFFFIFSLSFVFSFQRKKNLTQYFLLFILHGNSFFYG